jgi:hypothetical protein
VQRVIDASDDDGLVAVRVNPDHARSPLYALTSRGKRRD